MPPNAQNLNLWQKVRKPVQYFNMHNRILCIFREDNVTVDMDIWIMKVRNTLFDIFIMKYLFKRNVQVKPAQWNLGVYFRKTKTPWTCGAGLMTYEMIMYIFTEVNLSEQKRASMAAVKKKKGWQKIKTNINSMNWFNRYFKR